MYKIVFYVPLNYSERVKDALFNAGAGTIGRYDRCCFEISGIGQFRAMDGSNPFVGEKGELKKLTELRVEMVCAKPYIKKAIAALKAAHPYEVPAYELIEIFMDIDI